MTIKQAYLHGREHLVALGVAEPAIEAEMLLRHVLRVDRARLYTHWEGPLAPDAWDGYQALLEERGTGRPVHYIVGEREFMGLAFAVDERVMIPRPETELLVEETIRFLQNNGTRDPGPGTSKMTTQGHTQSLVPSPQSRYFVVDVGTGSGCIAISVAHYVPHATVYATDTSRAALDVARENARRHATEARVQLHHGDLLSPLPSELAGRIDVIASNPPYVPQDQARILPREVREFEPPQALFVPGDGTAVHRRLIDAAVEWLRVGGLLALEVGAGQADIVAEAVRWHGGYDSVTALSDAVGIERVVTGTRRESRRRAAN